MADGLQHPRVLLHAIMYFLVHFYEQWRYSVNKTTKATQIFGVLRDLEVENDAYLPVLR